MQKKILPAERRLELECSPVAQSAEQVAVNHRVRGSSPRWGAINECNRFPNRLLNKYSPASAMRGFVVVRAVIS